MPSPVVDRYIKPKEPDETAKKPVRKRHGWAGLATGLILGGAALAATRLGWVWPNFDVLSNFTLHVIFWIFSFALASIVPRHKVLAASGLFILLIASWSARSHIGQMESTASAAPGGTHVLHVGHFNTKARNADFDAVQREIEAMDADVVSILEARADKLPMLAKLTPRYPYRHGCIGEGKCEMAIYSKYPFTAVSQKGEAPDKSLPYVWVQFGPELGNLTYVAIHSQRFPNARKQWGHVRDLQKLIEKHSGNIIVTGDFNTSPFSRTMATMEESTSLTRLTNLATWPAQTGLPQLAIDHILVSKGVAAASPEYAGLAAGSDHLPIHMRLLIPAH